MHDVGGIDAVDPLKPHLLHAVGIFRIHAKQVDLPVVLIRQGDGSQAHFRCPLKDPLAADFRQLARARHEDMEILCIVHGSIPHDPVIAVDLQSQVIGQGRASHADHQNTNRDGDEFHHTVSCHNSM